MPIVNVATKVIDNLVMERISDFRKKYILDLTPEQEDGLRAILCTLYAEGKDVGIKIAAQSISNLVNEGINDERPM